MWHGVDVPPTKRTDAEAILPDLTDELARLRNHGHSYADIAFVLRTDHNITVTAHSASRNACGVASDPICPS